MAKVLVREENFCSSSLLLSLCFSYGEGQGQNHLKGRFSTTECLGYICKRQKVGTAERKMMSWEGMLPFSWCRCNLGNEYKKLFVIFGKGYSGSVKGWP